ncbi:MAG: LlaJI family restriction endonuclease [Clostridia bacterium]|nr:LlaJI family restriction endonuclease [Clostridia bacterium]
MRIDNLFTHKVTGESGNSFVGLKIDGNHIHFYYPECYHFDPDHYERDDFLDLLKTISIAKHTAVDRVYANDHHAFGDDLALLSYIWIIEDYIKNGFNSPLERVFKANQRGRINWKRTLQRQPMISGLNIVYSDLIVEVKSPRDTVLTEAYRYCVQKSASFLGWIYGIKSESIEIATNAPKMVPRYLDAIQSEMNRTFNDDNHLRFLHMKNVLLGLDEVSTDNSIVYGVDSYHYVFERMIDRIFGTENAEDFYPRFVWHLKHSADKELAGPTIRPDTIMKFSNGDKDEIYIIDSKFYRYGSLDLSQTKGLPEASSIVKQITYGSYVEEKFSSHDVFNVFILPYDSLSKTGEMISNEDEKLVYVGNVSSNWAQDKVYGTIYVFLIDLHYVVKTWNRLHHELDKKSLIDQIAKEKQGVLG